LPSPEAQAASLDLLEKFDGYAPTRNILRTLSEERREWSGYPMPLEDLPLTVEPTYPRAAEIMAAFRKPVVDDPEYAGAKIRNTFWSWRWRCDITVWERNGKIEFGRGGFGTQVAEILSTLGAADAWGVEQEAAAVQTLATLLPHRNFKQYMLTGMFLEKSRRSGTYYLFRRLRPTLAISFKHSSPRVLCALCMHPIGYYSGSWAGAMCPTDDVLAHLMLMRGDEVMFWRRSNQHPAWRKEAGI
jgi:hypothetical protein